MANESAKTKLIALLETLEQATEAHRDAAQTEDTARRNTVACLNNLNEAQKAVDAAIESLKGQQGNKGSDWWNAKHPHGMSQA